MSNLHPVFAGIVQIHNMSKAANDDVIRNEFIKSARTGQDGGRWAHHVPDHHITLQTINAVVRRSNLDAEAKLSAIRAAVDVAINDAADCAIDGHVSH